MNQRKLLELLLRVIVLLMVLWLISHGGWSLLWLIPLPLLVLGIVRVFRPAPPYRVPAEFSQPGEYRVVLQVPGPRTIEVIRELRRTTACDLLAAKKLVDEPPAVVAEGLSEQSAELVADRLRAAGARALAAPIGEM